ncbi:MAG TPA: cobalamin biosynthesis protein CbiM [Planctomycetes bacterium]|nr:cobalamin biosynthesis protein CbiM [Planctomycetota bacterium]
MHIPDGFVSGPINALGFALAVAACAIALIVTRRTLGERQAPLLGMTAAFVFAAQMLNFPVAGGTSGHFLGATFALALLGPWAACLVLSLVLIVQCLLFADGGLTALGSNIVNMGVVGVAVPAAVMAGLRLVLPRTRMAGLVTVAIAAWCSVMAAAAACALQLGASGHPLAAVLPAMLAVHAVIGFGEALITAAVVSAVLAARPDLLPGIAAAPRPVGVAA